MKLQVPFLQLPLQFDAQRLAEEVQAIDVAAWRAHPGDLPGNFALSLIARDGDPECDAVAGPMRPTPHLARCAYLSQMLAHIGAVWGRARLMKLAGHAEVAPHADTAYYWRERMHVHVPIVTRPSVRFLCDDAEVNMAAGECWIFDTWREHRVINAHDDQCVHLVADTVGSVRFRDFLGQGRVPGHAAKGWQSEYIAFAIGGNLPPLRLESVNAPKVMTPWELRGHIGFLLDELGDGPRTTSIRGVAAHFLSTWRGLWAQYGADERGWPDYRVALDAFAEQAQRLSEGLEFSNHCTFVEALGGIVLTPALRDRARRRHAG